MVKIEKSLGVVRRIPTNVRSLTGNVNGQEFESSLERDLLLLVHWDYGVDWYQSQPVKIDYLDVLGQRRSYTPDLLVTYRSGNDDAADFIAFSNYLKEQIDFVTPKREIADFIND